VADQGETVRAESWHVLVLQGELDLDSAPDLRRALLDAINQGHHMIVVDLTEATFIDSSGLGVLVNALRRLHGVDGELRVAAGRRSITTAIEMSGLDKLLGLFPDVDSALTAEVIRGTRLRAPNGQTDG
jgi:anti-sigma B factor antagonist